TRLRASKLGCDASRLRMPTHDVPLAGWPVLEPGLAMTMSDRVLVVHIDERLTPAAFARYLEEWKRGVDARPPEARGGAVYDVPGWAGFTAGMRREWGDMLKSREGKLRATTVGMALVTPSLLVRGALRAVFWMAPPPYPHDVVDTNEAAFAFL